MAAPRKKRLCENCGAEFPAFGWKQRFCNKPDCRERQRIESKRIQAEWHRGRIYPKPKRPKDKAVKCCFLCGFPLKGGERINHIVCIERRQRRLDGNYIYV